MKRKILFITGTRADYGKMKPLMREAESLDSVDVYVYVSGMHLLEKYGSTYVEIEKDHYAHTFIDFSQTNKGDMSYDLGDVICHLTSYVQRVLPDLVVVHGDRIDALAGAIVGAFHNIKVAHIEGGELSGTIDESIRHAISKFAHIHLVSNPEAKHRLIQLGEEEKRIYILGSPDIDIMLSDTLPSLEKVRERYKIAFDHYAILMYHPVTTEAKKLKRNISALVSAVLESEYQYVVVYPNNDFGSEIILSEYERLLNNRRFAVYPSLRFEHFLTLLKNADFMIGNSSAGIRETGIYGIPAIDIGSRQHGRYSANVRNICHVNEDKEEIIRAIRDIERYRIHNNAYGGGDSAKRFRTLIQDDELWDFKIQKHFIDINRSTL